MVVATPSLFLVLLDRRIWRTIACLSRPKFEFMFEMSDWQIMAHFSMRDVGAGAYVLRLWESEVAVTGPEVLCIIHPSEPHTYSLSNYQQMFN